MSDILHVAIADSLWSSWLKPMRLLPSLAWKEKYRNPYSRKVRIISKNNVSCVILIFLCFPKLWLRQMLHPCAGCLNGDRSWELQGSLLHETLFSPFKQLVYLLFSTKIGFSYKSWVLELGQVNSILLGYRRWIAVDHKAFISMCKCTKGNYFNFNAMEKYAVFMSPFLHKVIDFRVKQIWVQISCHRSLLLLGTLHQEKIFV